MGEKSVSYQRRIGIISRQVEGAAPFFRARINGSLSIMVTRNNSGALLLTTFVLKPGAATHCLPPDWRRLHLGSTRSSLRA